MKRRDNFWKKIPFLRILVAFCTGILLGYYNSISCTLLIPALALTILLPVYNLCSSPIKYKLRFLPGIVTMLIFIFLGITATFREDIRNHPTWIGHQDLKQKYFLVLMEEPLVNKSRSLKAVATILKTGLGQNITPASGKLILYFKKSAFKKIPGYGSQVVFNKMPEPVQRSGNPAAFDYARYCLFQGITHQVYLEEQDFIILPTSKQNPLQQFIFQSRAKILTIIRRYVPGKIEQGLAEALLIGYKDDLDKSLVTSYSNTGVVHIIAISGLHLGLIYWLFGLLLKPLTATRQLKWLRSIIIISGLWIFTMLAGAQPSILRSAVMFTCIVAGESLTRKTNVYNTLAVSAFILLCINPFWLWDAGLQLSYAAVLSIIIFMKPVYDLVITTNKLLDLCWKMNAVTISAQILTVPVCLYHFHQFPNLFLLTNFVAVPLSSIILLAEIGLCCISFIPFAAGILGECISWLIRLMNDFVLRTEAIPFSSWKNLYVTPGQSLLIYMFISAFWFACINRSRISIWVAISSILIFAFIRHLSFRDSYLQKKIIVYNVPGKTAVELVSGRSSYFAGDPSILSDPLTRSFHIDPARTAFRYSQKNQISGLKMKDGLFDFNGYRLVILSRPLRLAPLAVKQKIDLLVVSGKSFYSLNAVAHSLEIKMVVLCGSVSSWLKEKLKKECDSLRIPVHDTGMKGAFVKNIP